MLPAKRQARLLEHLRRQRFADLPELASALGFSVSTIRRDVDHLCREGHLTRTHGGAALRENESATLEPEPALSRELASAEKARIGARAAALITPGASLVLDSGSTTMAVARAALDRAIPFTAITNDVAIAAHLAGSPHVDVHVTGGHMRPRSTTLLGASCRAAIGQLHVDLAIMGAHKVCADGASETSIDHAEVKRAAMAAAARSILVVDGSKFGGCALCRFAPLSAFERIVTDTGLTPEARAAVTALDIRLDLA